MTKSQRFKICLAASAGGHLTQLLKVSGCVKGRDVFAVTTSDTVRRTLTGMGEVYVVGECNRDHPLRVLAVLLRCIRIVLRERPAVVISTGAAHGCLLCFLGKITGAKVIWMDSITNVDRISLSGRMVRFIADLFLVQWPELAQRYRGVEYIGSVI